MKYFLSHDEFWSHLSQSCFLCLTFLSSKISNFTECSKIKQKIKNRAVGKRLRIL